MRQKEFEDQHHDLWRQYQGLVEQLEKPPRRRDPAAPSYQFPMLYRRLCNHYAVARGRHYSPGLTEQLHALVLSGHRLLYRRNSNFLWRALGFVSVGFPAAIRRHAGLFWLALVLFYGPATVMGLLCYHNDELIYSLLEPTQVAGFEQMYDPAGDRLGRTAERASDTDFAMFGYYIMNNVGIAFRVFATGILAGIGTLFFLVFNGLVIGAVAGHLTGLGFSETFWGFVSGHSALELTAICISGSAGLLLARAVVAPGRMRRRAALLQAAGEAVQLVTGAALMLLLAAFVEAFWSSSTGIPTAGKLTASLLLWTGVVTYLLYAGRGHHGPG